MKIYKGCFQIPRASWAESAASQPPPSGGLALTGKEGAVQWTYDGRPGILDISEFPSPGYLHCAFRRLSRLAEIKRMCLLFRSPVLAPVHISVPYLRYVFTPHSEAETKRSLAQTSIKPELPSGKAPTALVRLRISRLILSIPLLLRIFSQCS